MTRYPAFRGAAPTRFKNPRRRFAAGRRAVLALMALALPFSVGPAVADSVHRDDVQVDAPWSRPTPPGAPMGAGYMVITNHSDQEIVLVAGETPRAGLVSIHETVEVDGLMRMRPMSDGLPIPAGGKVELRPLSYHLMLEQLNEPLVEGERIPLTLTFDGADPLSLELVVRPLDDAAGHQGHHHGGSHDHGNDHHHKGETGHSGGHHRH